MDYENRLQNKVAELMADQYDPFDVDNFNEAISNLTTENLSTIVDAVKNKPSEAGLIIHCIVKDHWRKLATTEAEARLEDEYHYCERCHGLGCSRCNEDKHMENNGRTI